MNQNGFPGWIFALWVGYGALGLYFLYSRNLTRKRRWLVPYIAGAGFLFLGFMALTGAPVRMVVVAAPFVAGIMWLNVRSVRFCASCGATITRPLPFQYPRFCPKCGAALPQRVDRDAKI